MNSSDSKRFCLVNGERRAELSVADRGLAYGDGLFETMAFREGYLPLWSFHWQRLSHGAEVLGLKVDETAIESSVKEALQWARDCNISRGMIKLILTRGQGGQGYIPSPNAPTTIALIVNAYQPLPAEGELAAVELVNCTYRLSHNPVLAGLKHLNRLEQVLAARSVTLAPGQQGLVLDKDDRLIETLHHNLFMIKNTTILTPDLSFCGVAGTLRRALLEQFAPALGLTVAVCDLYEQDLVEADEVFIANAVRGIIPVTRWCGKKWPSNTVTRQIMGQIAEEWDHFYDS